MVARLKLKDIDGRAPPGGFTPGYKGYTLSRMVGEVLALRGLLSLARGVVPAAAPGIGRGSQIKLEPAVPPSFEEGCL